MKTLKYGRLMGIGLGAGLAITAVSSFINQPVPVADNLATPQFQSLREYQASMASMAPQLDPSNDYVIHKNRLAVLATERQESELTEMLTLPPIDQLTASTMKVAFVDQQVDELNTTGSVPWESDPKTALFPAQVDSSNSTTKLNDIAGPNLLESWVTSQPMTDSLELEDKLANQLDEEFQLFANDGLREGNAEEFTNQASDKKFAQSEKICPASESAQLPVITTVKIFADVSSNANRVADNSWKKNPFLEKGGPVVNQIKNQLVPAIEIPVSDKIPAAGRKEASVLELGANRKVDNASPFGSPTSIEKIPSGEAQSQAPDAKRSSLASVVARPIKFAAAAGIADAPLTRATRDPSGTVLSASDPFAVAPLNLALTESVAQRAVQHIEYGKVLARRGASFSARQEFYTALRVIAQANDSMVGLSEHSMSLRRGIMALKEAEDFVVSDTETEMGLNVATTAEIHRAGVLTEEEAELLTPVEAMQRYLAVAQDQIQRSVGSNVVSSEALFCLGKLHTVESQFEPTAGQLDTAKAIVYHRAALASDQDNFRSANELGVLLARSGQLQEARDLFKKSLRVSPAAQSWDNLAKVHERMNEPQLAQLAQAEFQRSLQMNPGGSDIQWKPATQFNADAPIEFHEAVASNPAASQRDTNSNQGKAETAEDEKPKTLGTIIKDLF